VGETFRTFVDGVFCPFDSSVPSNPVSAPGPPSLESLARDDLSENGSTNNRTAFLDIRREYSIATDGAGNVAMSARTWNGEGVDFIPVESRGVTVFPPAISESDPEYLNFITGDDLLDVMNSIPHFDRGPDNIIGTPDDVPLTDIEVATGRARSFLFNGTIFVTG